MAANSIGSSPAGSTSSAGAGGDSLFRTSIGSFTIGSLSNVSEYESRLGFFAQPEVADFAPQSGEPKLAIGVTLTAIQLNQPVVGLQAALEVPVQRLELNIVGLEPRLATGIVLSGSQQLQLSVEGFQPFSDTDQASPFFDAAIQNSVEIVGLRPSLAYNAEFPPPEMTQYYDSSKFSIEHSDPVSSLTTEGGYKITRPKYLSKPKRKLTVGFTAITESNKEILEAFWNETKGGSETFTFKTPQGPVVRGRFAKAMAFTYKGMGHNRLWDVNGIEIEEI